MSIGRTARDIYDDPRIGEPVYRVAEFLPPQGRWTEREFFWLNDDEGLIELAAGRLRFLPSPTLTHQRALGFLFRLICESVDDRKLGTTYPLGYRVEVGENTFREPDILSIHSRNSTRVGENYAETADLVVEVVSDSDPDHDWITKKAEYAAAGIPEYWIADPRDSTLTIFTLDASATEYREAGRYKEGDTANSVLLDGLTVEVAKVFAAE
ncbi:MAG: Uma2 family endonuclease [Planctomycetaceae bacterium]